MDLPVLPRPFGRAKPAALLCLLVLAAPLSAQQVELGRIFEAGTENVYRITVTTTTAMGGFSQTHAVTVMGRERIHSVNPDGSAVVHMTTESLRIVMDGPMGRMEYDSQSGATPTGPLAVMAAMAGLVGETVEMTMARDGTTSDVSRGGDVLTSAMDMVGFPSGPVSPGSEWERDLGMDLGDQAGGGDGIGRVQGRSQYRLLEVTVVDGRRVARIDVTGTATMAVDPSGPAAGMSGDTRMEGTGEIELDVERGLMLRSVQNQVITMSMMGQDVSANSQVLLELVR